jgi:hypothetical protein
LSAQVDLQFSEPIDSKEQSRDVRRRLCLLILGMKRIGWKPPLQRVLKAGQPFRGSAE